jgi:restriction system protein
MAGRSQSVIEDLMDLTAKLPWWVGVMSALFSYVALHLYAIKPLPPPPAGVGLIGEHVVSQLFQTLALFGQYVLPFAFLLGAFGSAVNSFKRKIRRSKEAGEDYDHCIMRPPRKQNTSRHTESVPFSKTPREIPFAKPLNEGSTYHPGHISISEKPGEVSRRQTTRN